MGGLSKKIFQIKNLSEKNAENRLLVDSGNLLFKRTNIAEGLNQARLAAAAIVKIYQEIGYDAVAVGPLDLAGGLAFLQQTKNNHFPWISANIFDENEKLLFNNVTRRTIQGQDIVITALSGPPEKTIPGIQIKPWEDILPDLLQNIRAKSTNSLIILLSSLSAKDNQAIAEKFRDIQILISATQRMGNISPKLINNTLLSQTAKQGKHQGLLEITLGSARIWGQNSQKKLADLQNNLGSVKWQLQRLLKKSNGSGNSHKHQASIERLEKETQSLNVDISSMQRQLAEETKSGMKQDQFAYRFISLKKNMPNDQGTEVKIRQLNQDIRNLHTKMTRSKKKGASRSDAQTYPFLIGPKICGTCHELQSNFWKTTRHAKAYDTLLEMEKNLDTNCLPCHVTMSIQNGAFKTLSPVSLLSYPERLQAVGCETCHGNGKKHQTDPEAFKMLRTPTATTCLTCHTDDHDDNFIYEEKLKKVSCPKG